MIKVSLFMIKKILGFLDKIAPPQKVYAHCDIPCGIYDPHQAQVAAHTAIRMTKMLVDLDEKDDKKADHQIVRLTKVKEEHAELVKHEVRIIWGDFFKQEHIGKNPGLHDLVFNIMKLASKAKQEINEDAANELLVKVQEFAEIFWKVKGLEPVRIKSGYPTEGEIVSHR